MATDAARLSSEAVGQNMGFGPQELIMCFIAIMFGGRRYLFVGQGGGRINDV